MNKGKKISFRNVEMIKKVFCVGIVVYFSLIVSAFASNADVTYCNPIYKDVAGIYVNYKEAMPFEEKLDWEKAIKLSLRQSEKYLSDEGIAYKYTNQSKEEILNKNSTILYLQIIYSYVPGSVFTINPNENYMAVWMEKFRMVDGEIIKEKNTKVKFIPMSTDDNGHSILVSSAPLELLHNATCNVLFFTANKKCTNPNTISGNEIIPNENRCIEGEPPFDPVIDFYLNNLKGDEKK